MRVPGSSISGLIPRLGVLFLVVIFNLRASKIKLGKVVFFNFPNLPFARRSLIFVFISHSTFMDENMMLVKKKDMAEYNIEYNVFNLAPDIKSRCLFYSAGRPGCFSRPPHGPLQPKYYAAKSTLFLDSWTTPYLRAVLVSLSRWQPGRPLE